jgi:peptide/nickel transport system substrate-binding protein
MSTPNSRSSAQQSRKTPVVVVVLLALVAVCLLALLAYFVWRALSPKPTPLPTPLIEQATPTPAATGGGKLVYGLTLAPSNIDPHVGASSELGIPLTSVYDTLIYQNVDGSLVAGLAERWEVSGDGLVYTFYLRHDVKFHDGTPFDAQAVQFNLNRIVSPETKSQKAKGLLGPYDRTEVVDQYTVKVYLTQPYAPFLDSVSQVYVGMASPAAVQQWGAEYQLHQVGTGPFIFKEYVPQDHLTLVRNPDYNWAPDVYSHDGPAYLDEIEFRFFVDPAVRALALESGDADVMGEMPPQDVARLESNPEYTVYQVPVPGQPLQFFLNSAKAPTDDQRVRQALLYATDRKAIAQTIFMGYSPQAYGPLSAVTMGYDSAVEEMYGYDPAQAESLLTEAGWTDSDGDGIRDKDGQPLALQAYIQGWGYLPEVAQMLQAQLKGVGVDLQVQVVAYPAAVEAAKNGEHHLAPMVFFGSDPSILNLTYLSANADGGFNWSKVRDAELDRRLIEAESATDLTQRANLYMQAQEQIMDLALVLPVRDYVNLNVSRARVQGLQFDRRAWFPWLYDVYLEQ